MRITVLAVGRLKPGPIWQLYRGYTDRLTWQLTVKEVEDRRGLPETHRKEREAQLLRRAIPSTAQVIALDERGRTVTSEEFARLLRRLQEDEAVRDLAFLIGGAAGLSESLDRDIHCKIAFGAMTWPHMLVRVLLLEQLYRAQTILAGHPYHRS